MKVKRTKPSMWERLYIPAIMSGMRVTFKHMFRKKDTIQYPEQQHQFGERYRGVPSLVKDEDGREKCVACYMCQWVCPPLAITIDAAEYPKDHPLHQIEKFPKRFDINMLRCIFCGYCEEACPVDAIKLGPEYELADFERQRLVYTKDMLLQPEKFAPKSQYHADVDNSHRDVKPILYDQKITPKTDLDAVYKTHRPLGETASMLGDKSTARAPRDASVEANDEMQKKLGVR